VSQQGIYVPVNPPAHQELIVFQPVPGHAADGEIFGDHGQDHGFNDPELGQ
jgi:hypothetical protein